jgi:hypothetical protein
MYKYFISFRNEQGDWEDIENLGSDNLRVMSSEARDLQRILSQERKESGCYYAVFLRGEDGLHYKTYSAGGY